MSWIVLYERYTKLCLTLLKNVCKYFSKDRNMIMEDIVDHMLVDCR